MSSLQMLSDSAHSALTDRPNLELVKPTYGFIDTKDIVNRFERQGWLLHDARQASVKSQERNGYQRHLLRFRNEQFKEIKGLTRENQSIPELIVENSHDGSSALRVFFGVFRIACLNGIIAGTSLSHFRVIHSARSIQKIDEAIDGMTAGLPIMVDKVGRWSQVQLSDAQSLALAQKMIELRLAHTANVVKVDAYDAVMPQRQADTARDLYSVFNVVQEKALRGGIEYLQTIDAGNGETRDVWRKSRKLTSVTQSVRLNRQLWDAAEVFAS